MKRIENKKLEFFLASIIEFTFLVIVFPFKSNFIFNPLVISGLDFDKLDLILQRLSLGGPID